MRIPMDPELCMLCGVPLVPFDRFTCEECTERGLETLFCSGCAHYHKGRHSSQRKRDPGKAS